MSLTLRTVRELKNLRGKRVLLRIDANVPIEDGRVRDDARLWAVLPTVEYLCGRGAVVILLAHLGRPKGADQSLSLAPVAKRLAKISGKIITFLPQHFGQKTERALSAAVPGQIYLLENLRFDAGEESNSGSFAKKLAALGDAYVNDGFGVSHRAHASVAAITRYHNGYAGLLMEREITMLEHARSRPAHPAVALLGGAKISSKITIIKELANRYDRILLGGGLINALFHVRGFGIGSSLLEAGVETTAKAVLKIPSVVLPVDVVVGSMKNPAGRARVVPVDFDMPITVCKLGESILDIGPRTILRYAGEIKKAKCILWNGPMGYFEVKKFSHGTMALARYIAARSKGRAFGVVGGGETVEAVNRSGMGEYLDHISTGGGAMLEYMEGKTLPGVAKLCVEKKKAAPKKTKTAKK